MYYNFFEQIVTVVWELLELNWRTMLFCNSLYIFRSFIFQFEFKEFARAALKHTKRNFFKHFQLFINKYGLIILLLVIVLLFNRFFICFRFP